MRILFILLFLFGFNSVQSQYWATKQYGPNVDETLAVTGDANGNTYITGYFSSTANINGQTKSVAGLTDVFISKISPQGSTIWVTTAGGPGSDRGLSIAVDLSSNVIVSGFYTGSINFGNGITLQSVNGSQDAFVAKYNAQGEILWAKSGGSSGNSDRANGVAVDNAGNIFITGQFSGSANFGSFTLESLSGSLDVFVVKYDPDGNELWAKKGSGTEADRGLALTTDNEGSVYVTGQFSNDITFDNTHQNNILNAVFIIKISSSGSVEWFRYAGGTEQSIAHGITSNGSDVFLTGDFGGSITFLGDGSSALSSNFPKSIFIAAYSSSGSLLWKKSQGSSSAVSARDIACRDNQLAVVGWHECTFESLSQIYGEATFNSLGFKDVYVMRYNTAGEFIYARNFGSPRDEVATGVHIQTDGKEVITGVFREELLLPLGSSPVNGIAPISSPTQNGLYCGDPNYGKFGTLSTALNYAEDGFTIKAIDPTRSPMDIYKRMGGGCDLSIPEPCISAESSFPNTEICSSNIAFCPNKPLFAHNFIPLNSVLGYNSNYVWSPGGSTMYNSLSVSVSDTYSVTITSKDGCYSQTASAAVEIYPVAQKPLLSDDAGVNTLSQQPQFIDICQGESVNLWGHFPDDYSFNWVGPGIIETNQTHSDTVNVTQSGLYSLSVMNPEGCASNVAVFVSVHAEPPEIKPYIEFTPHIEDSLFICKGEKISAAIKDSLTGNLIPNDYLFNWQFSPSVTLVATNASSIWFQQTGWHHYSLIIKSKTNSCYDLDVEHIITDSIYVVVHPNPQVDLQISANPVACPNDTVVLFYSYLGDSLSFDFEPFAIFEDSMYVIGPNLYSGTVTATNEFGCTSFKEFTMPVLPAATPSINLDPASGFLCPGDSIALILDSFGTPNWQGPNGSLGDSQSLYVHQSGLYFAEVAISPTCVLVSNTVQVTEYSTPFIYGNGGVLCDENDSLEIFIETNVSTQISWLPPLSGTDSVQVVTEPGIYTANVMSCGLTTEISIEVVVNSDSVFVFRPDTTPVCIGDSIFITTNSSFITYNWSTGEGSSGIYVHDAGSYHVEVIDEYGCSLTSNSLDVDFEPLPAAVILQADPVCEGETQMINASSPFQIAYTDGLEGGVIQTDSVFIIPQFYGDTTVYAFAISDYCAGPTDSLKINAKPLPGDPILISDAPACTGTYVNLEVLNAGEEIEYTWLSPKGNTLIGKNIEYGIPDMSYEGWFSCFGVLNGCKGDTAEIFIPLIETRQVELPSDTAMCFKSDFKITPTDEFDEYIWHDGSDNPWFQPKSTSQVFLTAFDENGCKSNTSMYIELVDCSIKIPNVFTPNGDGKNDTWMVATEQPVYYRLVVYNRWGRIVFESNSINYSWDGNHFKTGEPCSEGVYFYILQVSDFEGTPFEQTGTVSLIRS